MYIHIVLSKVYFSTTFTTFIYFGDKSERKKMKENDFFFFEKFGYVWGMHAEVSQEYEYPKSIRYWYGSIFGVPVLHSLLVEVQLSYFCKFYVLFYHFSSFFFLRSVLCAFANVLVIVFMFFEIHSH